MSPGRWARWIGAVVAIDALGLGWLGLTWWWAGGGGGGLGPYLGAVARAATSASDLAVYSVLIFAYSAGLELVLRRAIQEPLARGPRWAVRLAVPTAAIAYGLTHAVYHPAGVIYAAVLGTVTAVAYAWVRDWRPLALWHVQWNALAIGGTLVLAMWGPGQPRDAVLVAYKIDRAAAGLLTWRDGWGWVDRTHYAQEQMTEALRWAEVDDGAPLTFQADLSTAWGQRTPMRRSYRHPGTDAEPWAVACAAVMDFNARYEQAQAEAPWWTGTPLSAHQFDDLPSVLLACLDAHPDATRKEPETTLSRNEIIDLMVRQAPDLVSSRTRAWMVPDSARLTPAQHRRIATASAVDLRPYSSVTATRRDRSPSPTGTVTVSTP